MADGFSGISFELSDDTYFAGALGFPGFSFLIDDQSRGRIFFDALPFLNECQISISGNGDIYELTTSTGEFLIDPIYLSDDTTPAEMTIQVFSGAYFGEAIVTLNTPSFVDINLVVNPDVVLWDNVQVDFRMPFSGYTLNQISNAFMYQLYTSEQSGYPPFSPKALTFNAGSNIANETDFGFGWLDRANVFMQATVDYTLDMGVFGTRNITEDVYIRFKE